MEQVYTFMNKNIELFDVEMEEGTALKITNRRENNAHLLPVGLLPRRNHVPGTAGFRSWWSGRRIPASRVGVKELLEHFEYGNMNLDYLAEKAFGLSLSDQYWLRISPEVKWSDVNFFENPFSDDIGELLMKVPKESDIDLKSPDNTSDGVIRKRWKIIDNNRYLIKGSSSSEVLQPQPFREVFAGQVAEVLFSCESLPFQKVVPYSLLRTDNLAFSKCANFVTTETEYVPFNHINTTYSWQRTNNQSYYSWALEWFREYGVCLDLLLILDYILLNEDRHFGNFGFIRCVNTGNLLYPAPVFDTGNCLFYDSVNILPSKLNCKPFTTDFEKQIAYVDLSRYGEHLSLLQQSVASIFAESFLNCYESTERLENILTVVQNRIMKLLSK